MRDMQNYIIQDKDGTPHFAIIALESVVVNTRKDTGRGESMYPIVFKDGKAYFVYVLKDVKEHGDYTIQKITDKPSWFVEVQNIQKKREQRTNTLMDKIEKINLAVLNDEQLLELYNSFITAFQEEFSYPSISDTFGLRSEEILIKELRAILKTKEEKIISKYLISLTRMSKKSFATNEREDLIRIALKIKESQMAVDLFKKDKRTILDELQKFRAIDGMLDGHVAEFFWILNGYDKVVKLDKEYFLPLLKELVEKNDLSEAQLADKSEEIIAEREKAIKELNLSEEIANIVRATDVISYMQDRRKARSMLQYHFVELLLAEIGKRIDMGLHEMHYTTPYEIKDLLLNHADLTKEVTERMKLCVVVRTPDYFELFTGKEAEKRAKHFLERADGKEISDVQGICASPGVAIGRAKIILRKEEISRVEKGDILIASMTTPDYAIAMHKAAAIVTDEGGITCHAAIVSREFGIPCVIGTKVATKVFKDNDLVEVRAHHGIVRKL